MLENVIERLESMNKIAIVYWSGTGNTKEMAKLIAEGAVNEGSQVTLYEPMEFGAELIKEYDVVAFGCPAMGAEELEEIEFAPLFEHCKDSLVDKKIALFGSYGWGDGEWMQTWEEACDTIGAHLVVDSLIINGEPDDEGKEACLEMGRRIAYNTI